MPTLVYTLKIDGPDPGPIRSFSQAISGLQRDTEAAARAATQHGSALSGFFSGALQAATGFLAANVFQTILGGLTSIGQGVIGAASQTEGMTRALTTQLGSEQAALAEIAQLRQEAIKSPFNFEPIERGAVLLQGMGVAAQAATQELHDTSNVVASFGGNTQNYDRVITALGQIQAKGKVSAEEINQLAENGIPGWQILADALGKTRADVIDLAQQGQISADIWVQAFHQFANRPEIAQAAEAQSHTLQGLVSSIQDIGSALGSAVGGPLIAQIEPTLERIVAGLQDPQVTATLAQWGAAAGQFVTGLIQAGETAFAVGGQILAALRPVTDAIGNLLGIQGGPDLQVPTFQPPDLRPAAGGADKLKDTLGGAATQAKSIKDQIADLERAQRESTRAAAETELTYQHQVDRVRDKIRALQDAYELENRSADRAELVAKIQKDQALAIDVVSSQGQAAAKRLVEEQARLRQLDREDAFRADKAKLESEQQAADAALQTTRETNAKAQRDTQERIDQLRAGQQAAGGLTVQPSPGAPQSQRIAGDDLTDRYAPPQAAPRVSALSQALDGLLARLRQLSGAPGAVLTAVIDDWRLFSSGLDSAGGVISGIVGSLDTLVTTLGGRDGLEGVFIAARFEGERLFASLAAIAPVVLSRIGNGFAELGGAIQEAIDWVNLLVATQKFLGDRSDVNAKAFAAAGAKLQDDQTASKTRHDQFVADDAKITGTYQQRIAAINADIDQRQEAAFRAADQRRGMVLGAPAGPGSLPGWGGQQYALPPQSAQTVNVNVLVGVDQSGQIVTQQWIDQNFTGRKVSRLLGDYISSGR